MIDWKLTTADSRILTDEKAGLQAVRLAVTRVRIYYTEHWCLRPSAVTRHRQDSMNVAPAPRLWHLPPPGRGDLPLIPATWSTNWFGGISHIDSTITHKEDEDCPTAMKQGGNWSGEEEFDLNVPLMAFQEKLVQWFWVTIWDLLVIMHCKKHFFKFHPTCENIFRTLEGWTLHIVIGDTRLKHQS